MSRQTINGTFTQNMRSTDDSYDRENIQECQDDTSLKLKIGSKEDGIINYDNIDTYYQNKPIQNFICAKSILSHDGYDSWGPESNIYDIIIVYKNLDSEEIIVDNWHAEYWYHEDDISFGLVYQDTYSKEDFEVYYQENLESEDDLSDEGGVFYVKSWGQVYAS